MEQDDTIRTRERITAIQALRGIAALAVAIGHARIAAYWLARRYGEGGPPPGQFGGWGVDLFFVISGFVMVHASAEWFARPGARGVFVKRRLIRIVPLYWLATLLVFFGALLRPDLFNSTTANVPELLKSLFFIPYRKESGHMFPMLFVGWTLNYEMYFYLFFGLSLAFGRWRWPAFGAWLVLALFAVPMLCGRIANMNDALAWLAFDPARNGHYALRWLDMAINPLILMFAAGVGIGAAHHSTTMRGLPIDAHRSRWLAVVAVMAVALQYAFNWRTGHGIWRAGITLVPLVLVLGLSDHRAAFRVPRPLMWLGNLSYSLYLFHPFAQGQGARLAVACGHPISGIGAIVVTTIVALAVATLSWYLLERHLCEWIKLVALQGLSRLRQPGVTVAAPPP